MNCETCGEAGARRAYVTVPLYGDKTRRREYRVLSDLCDRCRATRQAKVDRLAREKGGKGR